MNQYRYRLYIFFNILLLLLSGCSNSSDTFTNTITELSIETGSSTYSILINNNKVGTNNVTVLNGIYKSFNNVIHDRCTKIEESITINALSQTTTTYSKKIIDGYMYLSDEIYMLNTPFIELPIRYNSSFYGPFSAVSSENVYLNTTKFHTTYTNTLGHTFNNVMEAQDESGLIRIYINQSDYIVQKEDYRYSPTIQSLIKTD